MNKESEFKREQEYSNKPFEKGIRFFCSWSGGKDSCLALYRAIQTGAIPSFLLTMLSPKTGKSKTHMLDRCLIKAQSEALHIPLRTYEFEGDQYGDYEKALLTELLGLSKMGIKGGIFGDTQYGLSWENRVCASADMIAWLPLWHVNPIDTFNEFVDLGFKSIIICSNAMLGKEAIGQTLTKDLLKFIISKRVDPLGEDNEYHTFVYDGPIFSKPVQFIQGTVKRIGEYWINELEPVQKTVFGKIKFRL